MTNGPAVLTPELVSEIVRRLGGNGLVAARMGLTVNTVRKWRELGRVPQDRLALLRAWLHEQDCVPGCTSKTDMTWSSPRRSAWWCRDGG
jgi:hypothetical protein